jgi:hypothetical protein
MSKIPRFISKQVGGAQVFRVLHRSALRDAVKALNNARMGCAYSPAYKAILKADAALKEAIEAARPVNWEKKKVHL